MKQLLTILLSIVWLAAGAQNFTEKKLLFETITIDDGLSQGMVNCIMQDRYGFMWFATKDGINRYDGYNFVVYRHDVRNENSLADNFVFAIFEDSKGRIWIGTASQGLDLFDRSNETFTHFRHNEKNPRSICGNGVVEITEDKEGVVYVSTNTGLSTINVSTDKQGKESFSFTTIDTNNHSKVIAPYPNKIFISSNYTLYTINKQDKNNEPKRGFVKGVLAFANDNIHDDLYVITTDSILQYDKARDNYVNISANTFKSAWLSNLSKK